MFSIKRLVVKLSVVCAVVCAFGYTKGEDVHVTDIGCSRYLNAQNSHEENDIMVLLESVITEVLRGSYNQYNELDGYYGSAACLGSLPSPDCLDCLINATTLLFDNCGYTDGAQVKLVDCRLRFEHYQFSPDW